MSTSCEKCSIFHDGECPSEEARRVAAALLAKADRIMTRMRESGGCPTRGHRARGSGFYSIPSEVAWLIESAPRVLAGKLSPEAALATCYADWGINHLMGLR